MDAKQGYKSISSLFITKTYIHVNQTLHWNRCGKFLLLAGFFHVKSVLTDSFPQTDEPTYGRYWPSSHSQQGCLYSNLPTEPWVQYCTKKLQWLFRTNEAERTRAVQVGSPESKLPIQLKRWHEYHAGKNMPVTLKPLPDHRSMRISKASSTESTLPFSNASGWLLFLKHKWFIFRSVKNLFPERNPFHGSSKRRNV